MKRFVSGLAALLLSSGPVAAADFAISFKWCSGSSEIALTNVPKGTASLSAKMVDLFKPSYPHGGGKVAYSGRKTIPCGALTNFEGPSPPPPQVHDYRWTVEALDASGNVLATASATRKFPE